MRKTLLLVFIHGFKGGDDTFGTFPGHLQALLSHALPKVDVLAITYPKFETRGELKECVVRFREWLENKVIDLEVAHSTPSPTIDPSVHTILIGHSMGGIVAAETLLALANEQPLPRRMATVSNPEAPNFPSNTTLGSTTSTSRPNPSSDGHDGTFPDPKSFIFPHIQGILAFDTPFLGIAPGVIAHGAESHYKTASSAYSTFSELASGFGWGSQSAPTSSAGTPSRAAAALPAPGPAADAAAAPRWQTWGKYAMFAGAAGAVAAGGVAALYSQKDKLSAGWSWATSHLEFVGVLYKGEELKGRVNDLGTMKVERGIGSANFYTLLGKGANEGYGVISAGKTLQEGNSERTFCSLPKKVRDTKGELQADDVSMCWYKALNDKAQDETRAHMSMFFPKDNPGFYTLGDKAKEAVIRWVDKGWYESSEQRTDGQDGGITYGELGEGWEKPDHDTEEVKAKEKQKNDGQDWEGLDAMENDGDDDVRMRNESNETGDEEKESLEDSIIIDVEAKNPSPS